MVSTASTNALPMNCPWRNKLSPSPRPRRGVHIVKVCPVDNIYLLCYTATCLSSIAGAGYSSPFPSHQGVHTRWFGRALEWHSRGQRFDPAYLHHKKRHPIGCLFFILKVAGFWQARRILFLHFLSAQSCLWDWHSDSMKVSKWRAALSRRFAARRCTHGGGMGEHDDGTEASKSIADRTGGWSRSADGGVSAG